ncbi:hypothetical protein ABH937_005958 [Kitasatospora sp. GAS1066B]
MNSAAVWSEPPSDPEPESQAEPSTPPLEPAESDTTARLREAVRKLNQESRHWHP